MNYPFRQYDAFENKLIGTFRSHPLFQRLGTLTEVDFTSYLLQLAQLSLEFVRWQEIAKLGMPEEAAEIVRYIVREEIPSQGPTHKDNLWHDLLTIGVSTAQLRSARPSSATKQTIKDLYGLVEFTEDDYTLRTLCGLRVAGELMVAETYRPLVAELQRRYGLGSERSEFYVPHFEHDQKGTTSESHADAFDQVLNSLIVDERTLLIAQHAAEAAMLVRYRFHDQF
jgi:pyrroloquinoline quinone (PQQ) biosynthesis protein C